MLIVPEAVLQTFDDLGGEGAEGHGRKPLLLCRPAALDRIVTALQDSACLRSFLASIGQRHRRQAAQSHFL